MSESCSSFYITSLTGDHARLYTMKWWETINEILDRVSFTNPSKRKFLFRTSYFGMSSAFDNNSVQLPPTLCEKAKLKQEAIIVGVSDHLRVYSLKHLNEMVQSGNLKFDEIGPIAEIDLTNTSNDTILAAIDICHRCDFLKVLAKCREETALYIARHPDAVFDVTSRIFEVIIAEVMKSCGFEVELTVRTRDGGVDVKAVHKDVFGISTRYVIECKKWARGKKISVDLVRALYGTKQIHQADQAIFITTASFSPDTWNLSETGVLRNLTLVDFERLQEWFKIYLNSRQTEEY